MADWCLAVMGTGFDCRPKMPDYADHTPDYNQVIGNKFANNHADTSPPPDESPLQAADILDVGLEWLYYGTYGTGTGNCFSKNRLIKTPHDIPLLTFPDPLPGCI